MGLDIEKIDVLRRVAWAAEKCRKVTEQLSKEELKEFGVYLVQKSERIPARVEVTQCELEVSGG